MGGKVVGGVNFPVYVAGGLSQMFVQVCSVMVHSLRTFFGMFDGGL